MVERLETRDVPSGIQPELRPSTNPLGDIPLQTASPRGFVPSQIRHAYGIDQITFSNGTITGNGTGQTIAIVDAYDDPKLVNSTSPTFSSSDLHQFDVAMGIPDPPSFIKVNQTGGSTYPPTDPAEELGNARRP